jgi:16S rRNA (guanine(966)-N(2))-methyltransferase RsmD
MRIVAGKYRSRTLRSLRGLALRPTSDRLRETLFAILGPTVEGSVFVDVYAGTGAVGIEALSRGAREVIFIEKNAAAVRLIRRNLESLEAHAGVEILAVDAVRGLEVLVERRLRAQFFFLDPPYANNEEYERALDFLDASPLLTPNGRVIVEHAKQQPLPVRLAQLERTRVVEQGDAALSF